MNTLEINEKTYDKMYTTIDAQAARIAELEADAVNNARAFEDMLAANRAQAAELIELRTRLEILDNG